MCETDLLRTIRRENEAQLMIAQNTPVLVALSGGADSVALLRALLELGCSCRAAHCNFHLRSEESMRDERFVRDLCQRLDVPLAVKDFDVAAYQRKKHASLEMACRELRYAWFRQEQEAQQCCCIAVGHHAEDQVETFFLNLLRISGVRGLSGMERLNNGIWRPLLSIRRTDIMEYLKNIGQDYVTDSTNAQSAYRRNRLRNVILPFIENQSPQFKERVLSTMDNLNRDHRLLQDFIMRELPDDSHIDSRVLLAHQEAPTLLYHRIRHMGFNYDQCDQAVTAIRQGKSGLHFFAPQHEMTINRRFIDIKPTADDLTNDRDKAFDVSLSDDLSMYDITASTDNEPFSPQTCNGSTVVAFSTEVLNCRHIVLRHWKRGDRIKPFGMKGSKLVSDVFADLKLDSAAKQDAWILEADGDILWVLGYRAAAHYPVTPGSRNYILLKYGR